MSVVREQQNRDSNSATPRNIPRHISRAVSDPTGRKPVTLSMQRSSPQVRDTFLRTTHGGGSSHPAPSDIPKEASRISLATETGGDPPGWSPAVRKSLTRLASAPATPRQKSPPAGRPLHQTASKTAADWNGGSPEGAARPEARTTGTKQASGRRTPSQSSTTVSVPPVAPGNVAKRIITHTIHTGGKATSEAQPTTTAKKTPTYAVKKPVLPFKTAAARPPFRAGPAPPPRIQRKAPSKPVRVASSYESLYTLLFDAHLHREDVDDYGDMTRNPHAVGADRPPPVGGGVNRSGNAGRRKSSAAVPLNHPTPKSSFYQLSAGHQPSPRRRHNSNDEEQLAPLFADLTAATAAACPVRVSKKSTDNSDRMHRRQQHQQPGTQNQQFPTSSMSFGCRSLHAKTPSHFWTGHLQSTMSMSTIAGCSDAGRLTTRPVPVAPCGPAGHRQISKIPRPKSPAVRASASATSTLSRRSSATSLRSELNYARPMPVERAPISRCPIEYLVPLARLEVSATPSETFAIAGLSGQRRRHLPLTEAIEEDLWEMVPKRIGPLPVAVGQFDSGQVTCDVSIMSSILARPVSHATTQTRKSSLQMASSSSSSTVSERRRKKSEHKAAEKRPPEIADTDYSGMLMKLVQLLYLQTKLNSNETNNNHSASGSAENKPESEEKQETTRRDHVNQVINDYLKKHEQRRGTASIQSYSSSEQAARVYRMPSGSSVNQPHARSYPPNAPSAAGHHAGPESAGWSNGLKARSVYFYDDVVQPETKPRFWNQPPTAVFRPTDGHRPHVGNTNQFAKTYPHSGLSNVRHGYRPAAGR